MAIKKEEFVRNYSKAIREGCAAVFAGAGLSRSSGHVDWKGLLRPLADDIGLNVDKEDDLLSVAQFYRNARGSRGEINQTILNAFSKDTDLNENIRILAGLPISTYWTTNYDSLLEKGIQDANRCPDVKSETEQLPFRQHGSDAVVYKMHGDSCNPAHAVLTRSDYELYERNRPMFRTALKVDLLSKTFLFIGFSFDDPNLAYILGEIHSLLGENVREHYCFFKRVQQDDYADSADYEYSRRKQEMQTDNLKEYGIQTVLVDSYEEITDILRDVARVWRLKNVFISGSAESFSGDWTKVSAERFAGRLAGELVRMDCRVTSGFGLGIGSAVVNGALDVIYKEKFHHMDEYLRLWPFPQNISGPEQRSEKWNQYRESILSETGIAVFIFGNKIDSETKEIVEADGCIREFEIAREKGNLIIPIGITGYAARKIYEKVREDVDAYPYLNCYMEQLGTETDVDKIVALIAKIIQNEGK